MKKKVKNNVISIRLNQDEYDNLQEIAEKHSVSLADAVRLAIKGTYLIELDDTGKKKEIDNVLESIFKQIEYQEKKIMHLESVLYGQKATIDKNIKELERIDKVALKSIRKQMTINDVSN